MEVNIMKKKVVLPILIVLILAVAAGSVYYFFFRDKGDDNAKSEPVYSTYSLDDSFVTNVKDSNKLFKTSIVLVADSDQLTDLLKDKEYVVRDTILFLLRDLTEEDIRSETIQNTLRPKIAKALNEALGIDNIKSVYFGDFVMQ